MSVSTKRARATSPDEAREAGDARPTRSRAPVVVLGEALDPRNNSIGFLRLICALSVIHGHSFVYGGFGVDPTITATHNQMAAGRTAVDVFFCISGFLITWSFTKARGPAAFAWHRFLRIYPAYWVCIAITGLGVAATLGSGPDLYYTLRNLSILPSGVNNIPGLFDGGPGHGSVNGPLWTLRWELLAYMMVAILGILGLLTRRWITIALFAVVWGYFTYKLLAYPGIATSPAITSWSRLFSFFLAGMLFFNFKDRIPIRTSLFVGAVAVMIVAILAGNQWVPHSGGLFYIVAPLPLTYAVFFLAVRLPRWIAKINNRTDISYGLYIYGTLLLGILVDQQIATDRWITLFGLTTILAVAVATCSWFVVERPALKHKHHALRKPE